MKKVKANATIKLRAYEIIEDAIDNAVNIGFYRAKKHTDKPTDEHIVESISREIMNSLSEIIDFGND